MDNLGSQVGQKMRSAVKAKLIELGTGGAAGYIDDELPDYVMIMVANKRSKQQMISDLNLFLGTQTELFVTWLHEVLQKLQEVTLPANVVQKRKRKSSENDSSITTKKEKKEKRKEKKSKKNSEKLSEVSTPSISDVFANHLLEQAKKSVPIEAPAKKETLPNKSSTDEFDIPTITEIAEQSSEQSRKEKDLNELAEIQKKINQAKRHLKGLEMEESEDEDFLNIKEDAEEFDEIVIDKCQKKNKEKSPIVFNPFKDNEETKENQDHDETKTKKHTPITFNPKKKSKIENDVSKKKSVHERLGYKSTKNADNTVSLSAHRRSEVDTHVSSFRRRDPDKSYVKKSSDSKDYSEDSIENDRNKSEKINIRRRIGSRVIVAPPKPEYKEDEEENEDRPVNSLIKIKPRPPVSPSKQASKNLLLRAVAEAQKSTALVKPKKEYLRSTSPPPAPSRIQRLYTKSYRNRNREAVLKRATKDNIVIEVNAEKKSKSRKQEENEYIPEPISDKGDSDNEYIYVPQIIDFTKDNFYVDGVDRDNEDNRSKTQFVVTLDEKTRDKYISKHKLHLVERNSARVEVRSRTENNNLNSQINRKPGQHSHDHYKGQRNVKKIIIQNDSEDDESLSSSKDKEKLEEKSSSSPQSKTGVNKTKWSTVSPITFDLDGNSSSKRAKSERDDTKSGQEEEKVKVSTKKGDTLKKYDNIPELLSAVPVDSSGIKSKQKERCKYFPSCGKGDACDFYHPTMPCKAFPNCKFADKCLYLHPKCKFDLTCNRIGCNFSHSVATVANAAPPLSSHVVPVQNYKSISAAPLPAMCKYYPNCTNTLCNFYHPKLCRFGKNCMNKVECNFYHHDLPNKDKFKWVASMG